MHGTWEIQCMCIFKQTCWDKRRKQASVQDLAGPCCKILVRHHPLILYHIPYRGFHQTWLQQMLTLVHSLPRQMFGVSLLNQQSTKWSRENYTLHVQYFQHFCQVDLWLVDTQLYFCLTKGTVRVKGLVKRKHYNRKEWFQTASVITVLYTSTLSVLRNPFMLPLPYRISKSVPFFW